MTIEKKKKSSIPMPKVHTKISSITKENSKSDTKNSNIQNENPKTNENSAPNDTNISRKRKLSKIDDSFTLNENSKIDTTSNLKPSKFARKSISQTSKLFNRHTLTSSHSKIAKAKDNTSSTKSSPISKANTSITKSSPISKANTSITKESPISKANTSITKESPISKANTSITKESPKTKTNKNSNTNISRQSSKSFSNISKINSKTNTTISKTNSNISKTNTSMTKSNSKTTTSNQPKSKISSLNTHGKILLKAKTKSSVTSPPNRKSITKNNTTTTTTTSTSNNSKDETNVTENKNNKIKSKFGLLLPRRPRRPGWDVKGQLEDARKDIAELSNHVESSNQLIEEKDTEIKEKTEKIEELKQNVETKETTIETMKAEKDKENQKNQEEILKKNDKIDELQTRCKNLEETYGQFIKEHDSLKDEHNKLNDEHKKIKTEFEELTKKFNSTNEQLIEKKDSVEKLSQKVTEKEKTISELEAKITNFIEECQKNKTYIQKLEELKNQNGKRIKNLEDECERHLKRICDLEIESQEKTKNILELEEQRRFLHNEIQELKGNIRVFCRVRPVLQSELEKSNQENIVPQHITYPKDSEKGITLTQPMESAMGSTSSKAYPFTFDKVFNDKSQQKEIFSEIAQLVQSALDGYNVCIFAYGQTGSGKTYTMEGGNDEITMGMIPRAVQQIFIASEAFKKKGWIYDIDCQFLEIYNETIRDLLENDETKRHDIKHLSNGRTIVTDAKIVQVTTSEEVNKLLQIASKNRSVGATLCNERSSRSHSIFTLHLSGHNTLTEEKYESSLNLIDLAGSERLAVSGATGDRLKETRAINKSLSCLSDVIAALGNNEPHIPYRNSKLTYLLQNSLGGNSKTLMFVNISPLYANLQETLCSLRFATKVNSCQIGTAKKILK